MVDDLKELEMRHEILLELMTVGLGDGIPLSMSEMSEFLNIPLLTLRTVTSAPLFQKRLREKKYQLLGELEGIKKRYQELMPEVQDRHLELVHSENLPVAMSAVKHWTDCAGLAKDINVNLRGVIMTANYSDEELKRVILQRLEQKKLIEGEDGDGNGSSSPDSGGNGSNSE